MGLLLILWAWGSLCVDASSSSSSSSSSSVGMFRASYLDWLEPVEGRFFFFFFCGLAAYFVGLGKFVC